MKVLSNNEGLRLGPLFSLVYHTHCSPLLVEAGTQQVQWNESVNNSNEIFEHPSLNLASLFDQVRKCGQLPSSMEMQIVQDFVQECKDDIKVLQLKLSDTISNISQLSRTLSETSYHLSRRLDQVRLGEYLLPQQGLTSPSLLPQDVLEQIFLACLRCDASNSPQPSPNRPPLQLAAVSHRWRMIALSLPPLWSQICVDPETPSSFNLAKAWMQRCTFYHLRIRHLSTSNRKLEDFLAWLQSSAAKIRLLDVNFRTHDLADDVWSRITQIDCTELSELVFTPRHPRIEVPHNAPRLKYLYFYEIPKSWKGNTRPPSQLVVLSITSPVHWNMLEHLLSCCPLLQSLLVSVAEFGSRYSHHPSPAGHAIASSTTTLNHLKIFGLINDCKNQNIPANFLGTFTFPVLTTFEYYAKQPAHAAIPWLSALEFVHQVRRLSLHISDLQPEMISTILNAAVTVQDLRITCRPLNVLPPILKRFSSMIESSTMVPRLEFVQFMFGVPFSEIEEHSSEFVELIKSMSISERVVPLRRLGIGSWKGRDDSVVRFRSALGECANIDLVIFGLDSVMFKCPYGFEMYVPPSHRLLERDILQPDGSWRKEFVQVDALE
ncbi:hypothetical protein BDN72DRAFT_964838 [Pluteus cervinus]|uniref:Uncharacterized protein n=1 Tax=Pluteus cervinus TaxID=181527 RepID=A0ACD3A8G2_9AGAR|nr:hypothetical protein BDN72DRAFT_964838 [Pluteus cervinus]